METTGLVIIKEKTGGAMHVLSFIGHLLSLLGLSCLCVVEKLLKEFSFVPICYGFNYLHMPLIYIEFLAFPFSQGTP